ncbi:MAG: glycerol-3-phosphate 1-O-acyltransferase PlsY [SAR202 cluster bacterium]|nr:glycerol-3-phosphate 1-O-acyltransferase PlsY [SAR202 cluster bacterium]
MIGFLLSIIIAYLIGSISFGVLAGYIIHNIDIRKYGSGGSGATNVLRTIGKPAAAIVLLLDISKAVIYLLLLNLLPNNTPLISTLSALALLSGHIWPIYFKFHGGRGIAPALGALLIINPIIGILSFLIAIIVMIISKYVSLGSIIGTLFGAISLSLVSFYNLPMFANEPIEALYAIVGAILIVGSHRKNIKRLLNKTESKLGEKIKIKTDG